MKTRRSIMHFALLALAVLLMAGCQPEATAETIPTQADNQAPAPVPTETSATVENIATLVPAKVTATATLSTESTEITPAAAQVPEGWQLLTDSDQGFSIAYPPEWVPCEEHLYSRIFCDPQAEPSIRLYVLAVPQDYTNENFEVYNFTPMETIREYMALPVGEAMSKSPGAPAEWFSYTRLHNRMIAGWSAAVIESEKVWDFPEGAKERVVFIVTESTTYTIGIYYQTPEQLDLFERILDSFQLVP